MDHFYGKNIGGGEEYLLTAAEGIKSEEFEPIIVCLPDSALKREAQKKGLKTYEVNFFTKNILKDIRSLQTVLNKIKPDIVNTHGYYSGVAGRIAAKRENIKNIVNTVHTEVFTRSESPLKDIYYGIRNLIEKATSKNIYYVAVSNWIGAQLKTLGVKEEAVSVIYPCVSKKIKNLVFKPPKDKFVFGSAGRLASVKGYDLLLKAFSKLTEKQTGTYLSLRGDGKEKENLIELSKELGISDKVEFTGWVTAREKLYEDLNVFVSPSTSEGFSITLAEASVLGIPCICTAAGGQVEIIEDGKTGYVVKPGDVDSLYEAMEEAFNNYPKMLSMGEEARRENKVKFRAEKLIKSHVNLFNKLVSGSN